MNASALSVPAASAAAIDNPALSTPGTVTDVLAAWNRDAKGSLDAVVPRLVGELRRMAGGMLAGERAGQSLAPTALVHELYLRLLERRHARWSSRAHFLSFAARTMRRILVDRARRHRAGKRGGGSDDLPLDEAVGAPPSVPAPDPAADARLLDLDRALARLERLDVRLVRVVELRHFAGLTIPEIADALGVGTATVSRDWATARAWLHRELTAS